MGCRICLNEMCNGGCCDVDYSTLQSIEYGLKTRIAEIGNSYASRLKEGYSCSPAEFEFKINSIGSGKLSKSGELIIEHKYLSGLLAAIQKEIKNIYNSADSCVKSKTICKIKDIALGIIGLNCLNECRKDILVDTTNEEDWIASNPYCVSKEKWEENLYRVCTDMSFNLQIVDFENIKTKCNIVYDLVKEYQNCALDFSLEKTEEDCKIEFGILSTELNCTITYDTYRSLLDCGITYDTIRTALDCGITFGYSREDRCPMIFTIQGGYSLCNIEEDQNEQLRNIIKTFTID